MVGKGKTKAESDLLLPVVTCAHLWFDYKTEVSR